MSDNANQFGPIQELKKKKPHKKLIITVLVVLGLASLLYAYYQNNLSSRKNTIAKEVSAIVVDAQKLSNTGKITDASAAYDSAINKTEDSVAKGNLLISKATIYLNNGEYDTALSIAKGAESISQNDVVTSLIAQIYEKQGNKQKAIEYYKKTLTLMDKTQPTYDFDTKFYQSEIDSLSKVNN